MVDSFNNMMVPPPPSRHMQDSRILTGHETTAGNPAVKSEDAALAAHNHGYSNESGIPKKESDKTTENSPQKFSNSYLQYSADPQLFDKGFYGIGFVFYNELGYGATLSVHGNWGIVHQGNLMFKFGPAYGYALSPNFMANASLRGFIHTYDKQKKNSTSTDQKINGGISITPGITLRLNRVMLNAGFEFGWINGSNRLYKNIEIGLGYHF